LAERKDELVFTETAGVSANAGVLNVAGTNAVTITGDSIEDLSYDDLSKAIWGVPTMSEKNGRFYMNREVLGVVQRIVDGDGRHIWQRAMADGTPATILGKPYELVDVMPRLSDDAEETPFIIFGDLRYVTLGERTGLALQVFDTGQVLDPDDEEVSINLLTQDMKAIRAVQRMNAIVRFPTAFSVISTGASAS
jgi:HK97 family phage major capsid protein